MGDGTDCVMLSGETAAGDFPVNAVTIMRRVCEQAEAFIDYSSLFLQQVAAVEAQGQVSNVEAVCASAVKAATVAKASMIMALTETGQTALMLAKYRPKMPILAIAASESVIRQLQYARGVVPIP